MQSTKKKEIELPPAFKPYRKSKKANVLKTESVVSDVCIIPEYRITCNMNLKSSQLHRIDSSYTAALHCRSLYDEGTVAYKEYFFVLFLNRANKVTGFIKISEGGLTGTVADPRIILQAALMAGASAVVVSHNHPSGNLNPSRQEAELTEKLKSALKYFDITIVDHIIIGDEGYYSFANEGLL